MLKICQYFVPKTQPFLFGNEACISLFFVKYKTQLNLPLNILDIFFYYIYFFIIFRYFFILEGCSLET